METSLFAFIVLKESHHVRRYEGTKLREIEIYEVEAMRYMNEKAYQNGFYLLLEFPRLLLASWSCITSCDMRHELELGPRVKVWTDISSLESLVVYLRDKAGCQ